MALAFTVGVPSVGSCAAARPSAITPATINQALNAARDGDVLVLGPGVYKSLFLRERRFATPIIIDAKAATIAGIRLREVEGVTFRGGTFQLPPDSATRSNGGRALSIESSKRIRVEGASFVGPGATSTAEGGAFGMGYGIKVLSSSDVEVRNNRFQGLRSGVSVTLSQDFVVAGNTFKWMRSDGIDVARSRKGLVEGNACSDTRILEKEHPDCIQLWSRPDVAPTADIVVRGNRAEGGTQGIGAFNHVRDGVNDGGFDRILIEDNIINVSRPNGITLNDARGSIVRNNRVTTLPGAKWRARIRVNGDIVRCGNTVAPYAGKPAENDPKC